MLPYSQVSQDGQRIMLRVRPALMFVPVNSRIEVLYHGVASASIVLESALPSRIRCNH
jgi:hypothetical protein